jgi:hypothetical protein
MDTTNGPDRDSDARCLKHRSNHRYRYHKRAERGIQRTWILTVTPAFFSFLTLSGASATRSSPSSDSFGTPTTRPVRRRLACSCKSDD